MPNAECRMPKCEGEGQESTARALRNADGRMPNGVSRGSRFESRRPEGNAEWQRAHWEPMVGELVAEKLGEGRCLAGGEYGITDGHGRIVDEFHRATAARHDVDFAAVLDIAEQAKLRARRG